MNARWINRVFGALVLIGIAVLIGRSIYQSRPAPEPSIFHEGLTFEEAMAREKESHKPVLVLASATWCGPCQAYQRGALVDARIEQWVATNATAAHIDVEQNPIATQALQIAEIPATILLRDGKELGRVTGKMSAPELLAWLEETCREPEENQRGAEPDRPAG